MYDGKQTLKKGGLGLLYGALAVAGLAVAEWLADSPTISAILISAGLSEESTRAIVPLIVALSMMAKNWLSHRAG